MYLSMHIYIYIYTYMYTYVCIDNSQNLRPLVLQALSLDSFQMGSGKTVSSQKCHNFP